MSTHSPLPGWKDKALFTPGPLTTSRTVKQAMLRDAGSRDGEFIAIVADIRKRLLQLANTQAGEFEAVLLPGSGTYSVEAVVSTALPRDGELLVIVNGAYGQRIAKIAETLGIRTHTLTYAENTLPALSDIESTLQNEPGIALVAAVHCETTSGIINPIQEIGRLARQAGKPYFVDAMSSFGAIPIDLNECGIDYLVSSANKCIEGVPGFGFTLARTECLTRCEGQARSLSLDLHAQWKGLEKNGQFRFTPPTQSLLAFHQALLELEAEGGVEGRGGRYQRNHQRLIEGMRKLGFQEYVPAQLQGPTITSFLYPDHPNFEFEDFYERLNQRGCVIYPGKVTQANCFRIGNIGRLDASDIDALLLAIRETVSEMQIVLQPAASTH